MHSVPLQLGGVMAGAGADLGYPMHMHQAGPQLARVTEQLRALQEAARARYS